MNDIVTSLIRTIVPMVVGWLASTLAVHGINVDPDTALNLGALLTAVFGALYYTAIRLWEKYKPAAGVLLGVAKTVEYTEPKEG